MMKVYQPVCPDIKLRLVPDLSPETVEVSEDSALSSDSSACTPDLEDTKLKLFQENDVSIPHTALHPGKTVGCSSLSSLPGSSATDSIHQHVSHHCPPSESLASELSSAQHSPQSSFSNAVTELKDSCFSCTSNQSFKLTADGSTAQQSTETAYNQNDADPTRNSVDTPASCCLQRPVCFHDKLHCSFDQNDTFKNNSHNSFCQNDDDDDDNDSIEDISISHNVPNSPPPPVSMTHTHTRPMSHRVDVTKSGEAEPGRVSSSQGKKPKQVPSSGLHLDVHSESKYHNPYTLACAITPSPLHEHITIASTLSSCSNNNDDNSNNNNSNNIYSPTSEPCDTSDNYHQHVSSPQPSSAHDGTSNEGQDDPMSRSIFDEIQEALIKEVSKDDAHESPVAVDVTAAQQYPFIHKHMGHLFDKKRLLIGYTTRELAKNRDSPPCRSRHPSIRSRHVSGSSVVSEAAGTAVTEEVFVNKIHGRPGSDGEEDGGDVIEERADGAAGASVMYEEQRGRKNSDGDGSRRHSSSTMATPYSDLEVTHRGMHRFIPRHADEVQIGIGDPIHVIKEFDDLWCEGVNLRSGERGLFPAMYANDLMFLEESDEEDEHWRFTMRFLGTVEVSSSSGDFALCQAINKVAQQGRIKTASLCSLEINQYGIRMIDKSKEGHESEKFSNFFALKNISFCGTHPNNNRYFAFITKHPREIRFACHVFHSERSTHRARDALGKAFKRFYQEYMAFTHPTEDIWIE